MTKYEANLHVKMSRQLYEKLGQLADAKGVNRSELVRGLLIQLIFESKSEPQPSGISG